MTDLDEMGEGGGGGVHSYLLFTETVDDEYLASEDLALITVLHLSRKPFVKNENSF